MRLLRCSVSLLLVFVLLFALCSTSCFAAAETDKPYPEELIYTKEDNGIMLFAQTSDGPSSNYSAKYRNWWLTETGSFDKMNLNVAYTQAPPSDTLDSYYITPYTNYEIAQWFNRTMVEEFTMLKNDGSIMAKKNQGVRLLMSNLNGVFYGHRADESLIRESYFDPSKISEVRVYLMYPDGSISYTSNFTYEAFNVSTTNGVISPSTNISQKWSLNLTIENLPKDIIGVNVEVRYIPKDAFNNTVTGRAQPFANCYMTRQWVGYTSTSEFSLYLDEATNGLLGGILDIVRNIKDGVTDTVSTLTSGFSNVVSSITELPSKIWSFIENGLKALFVPTEQDMTSIKEDWDNLLSDRFGGLYQSVQLIDDYASTFTNTDTTNSIKVPELSVDLVDSTFTFGGQDVQIIPDKFSFLIDVIKTIISIIATTLFVNGLRNRFTREVIEGGNEQ